MKRKSTAIILHFLIRAVLGMALIFFINNYIFLEEDSWQVGMNLLSFLTSGSLGIPGVCMLYGIIIYQNIGLI